MTYIIAALFAYLLYTIEFHTEKSRYLEKYYTDCLKGVFLLLVFLSHAFMYYKFNSAIDYHYGALRTFMGQSIVVVFLFYSGYGVYEGIKNKLHYIDSIPSNRIFKVIWQFDVAVVLFWILNYISGSIAPLERLLLSFVAWQGLGNSNWYIFCILFCYGFTWVAFKLLGSKEKGKSYESTGLYGIGIVVLLSIGYILVMKNFKPYWWFDTILVFPLGMLVSKYKEKINYYLNDPKVSFNLVVISVVLSGAVHYKFEYTICKILFVLSMTVVFILISRVIYFDSRFLEYIGKNLFGFYILQRLPMIYFSKIYRIDNKYVFLLVCFLALFPLNWIFNKGVHYIQNFLSQGFGKTKLRKKKL